MKPQRTPATPAPSAAATTYRGCYVVTPELEASLCDAATREPAPVLDRRLMLIAFFVGGVAVWLRPPPLVLVAAIATVVIVQLLLDRRARARPGS